VRKVTKVKPSLLLATAVAMAVAGRTAWGHRFPAVRTVVAQVESCELVVMVGYRPGTGEATEAVLARAASLPKSQSEAALRDVLATYAMAPLAVEIDGKRVLPTAVRAKLGVEPGGARPMVVLLVTYPLEAGHTIAIRTTDPRSTRISWTDRDSHRVVLDDAPAQGRWFNQVASFLLNLRSGGSACASSPSLRLSSH